MGISIEPYRAEHVVGVKAFNQRLRAGGAPADYVFPEDPALRWLPSRPGSPVYNEAFVARDGEQVRGAFLLKHQPFWVAGEIRSIGYYHHPYSEGIVDRAWAIVGVQMLRAAVAKQPMLYALGMGGYDRPLPRMLMAMKWAHALVPFRYRVARPARFLREMEVLRTPRARRWIADAAAATGVGWAGIKLVQRLRTRTGTLRGFSVEVARRFPDRVAELWDACRKRYRLVAVRDAVALAALYPVENPRFRRVLVKHGSELVGWAVAAEVQKRNDLRYGNLRVGYILDSLAFPEHAVSVIAAAAAVLEESGVDLLQSNQNDRRWVEALDANGFLTGPSNFIFAAAPALAQSLGEPWDEARRECHLNRADGDGLYQYV